MTLAKIAEIAGVSNATVSRVINRQSGVSVETARAVEAVMKEVGFVPPELRRGPKPNSKRGARERRIALLVCGTASHANPPAGFLLLLQGVEAALARQDLHLNLVFATDLGSVPPALVNDPPRGLLITRETPIGEAEAFYSKMPVVWLMGNRSRPHWGDQVMPNNESIGRLAADYLLARGHRKLAFLNMRHGDWHFDVRANGFKSAAEAAGATVEIIAESAVRGVTAVPPESRDTARAATVVGRLLNLATSPTGLFVAEDAQMPYFHPLFLKHEIPLGHGVDIISCNRELPYLTGLTPAPATIDIRFDLIGQIAVERLLWRIDNPEVQGRIVTLVDPLLVEAH